MTFEEFIQPNITTIIGGLTTILVGVNSLFFRWLSTNFNELKASIKENAKDYSNWLSEHEDKDQLRHEDNLYRFEKISVALARLGSDNGTHDKIKSQIRPSES